MKTYTGTPERQRPEDMKRILIDIPPVRKNQIRGPGTGTGGGPQETTEERTIMKTYIVICVTGDGVGIEEIGEVELLSRLNSDYYEHTRIARAIPEGDDPMAWPSDVLLIIEGRVRVPKAVQTVTEYTFEEA